TFGRSVTSPRGAASNAGRAPTCVHQPSGGGWSPTKCKGWRRGGDSNPRNPKRVLWFSKPARSAAPAPLHRPGGDSGSGVEACQGEEKRFRNGSEDSELPLGGQITIERPFRMRRLFAIAVEEPPAAFEEVIR